MRRDVVETPGFARALRKFAGRNRKRQDCVAETLLRMGAEVFDPRLRTHGLSGNLDGRYACSCGYDCRIVFELVKNPPGGGESILLLDVGTHDEVY